ncbi:hypothetical protein OXPF_36010 [Oxobacter pfennigii]|uniref:Lipoprotein n=1 Tax=Oxobacter pfennigii TaxID=36849 RepID=A0A0P8W4U4_9CLOT|nr:hypothetical protein [Oxobacter pfennigii]KPU42837.1 hypothetical protein OXPF_36010 [Oxobacter pfennigii]
MKKFLHIIISFLLILCLISCTQRKAQPKDEDNAAQKTEEKEDKPDKKEGEILLHNYARALILKDEKIVQFYTDGMKQSRANFSPSSNPHPNGYIIDSVEEKEGKLEGKMVITVVYTGQPYFSSDESKVTIVKEKGMYLIDKIEKSKTVELIEKGNILHLIEEGAIKGTEILRIDELPRFAVPQGASPDHKYNIGNEKFGPVALDAKMKMAAVSTVGEYPALLIVDIEKKQVKPIDIYFEGNVETISWSQDGKYLASENSNKDGRRFLNIYDVEKEKMVDDPMKDAFKSQIFSVNNPYWISGSDLIFNIEGTNLSLDEQKKAGAYKFDVKNVSLTKF